MNIIYLVKLNHLCNCNTLGSQMIRLGVGGFRGRYDWGICANFWKLIVGRVWFAEERDNIQIRKGQLQFTDCGFNNVEALCNKNKIYNPIFVERVFQCCKTFHLMWWL